MQANLIIASLEKAKGILRKKPYLGATPIDHQREIGQPVIINIVLDVSGSIDDFRLELVSHFNTIILADLKRTNERFKSPLRVGCLLFSDKLLPAWEGFKSLKELGPDPLKIHRLKKKGLGGRTALYGAMRSAVLWTAATREHMYENGDGELPRGRVIVLTDGANNKSPRSPMVVRRTLREIGEHNAQNIQAIIGLLDTNQGMTLSQFETMVSETGFESCGVYQIKKGSSILQKLF